MRELENCPYRVALDTPDTFFCRHSLVHSDGNIVHRAMCRTCTLHKSECQDPRPVPAVPVLNSHTEASLLTKVWNLTAATAAFVSDGMTLVDASTYAARLAVCDTCDSRTGNYCGRCGCRLSLKASGRVFQCPLGKWAVAPVDATDE